MTDININRFTGTSEDLEKFLTGLEGITPEHRQKLIFFWENGIRVSAYGLLVHGIPRDTWHRLLPAYYLQEVEAGPPAIATQLTSATALQDPPATASQDSTGPTSQDTPVPAEDDAEAAGETPRGADGALPEEGEGGQPSHLSEGGEVPSLIREEGEVASELQQQEEILRSLLEDINVSLTEPAAQTATAPRAISPDDSVVVSSPLRPVGEVGNCRRKILPDINEEAEPESANAMDSMAAANKVLSDLLKDRIIVGEADFAERVEEARNTYKATRELQVYQLELTKKFRATYEQFETERQHLRQEQTRFIENQEKVHIEQKQLMEKMTLLINGLCEEQKRVTQEQNALRQQMQSQEQRQFAFQRQWMGGIEPLSIPPLRLSSGESGFGSSDPSSILPRIEVVEPRSSSPAAPSATALPAAAPPATASPEATSPAAAVPAAHFDTPKGTTAPSVVVLADEALKPIGGYRQEDYNNAKKSARMPVYDSDSSFRCFISSFREYLKEGRIPEEFWKSRLLRALASGKGDAPKFAEYLVKRGRAYEQMSYHQLLKEAEARFLPDTDVDEIWGNLTTARQEATETVQDWWHRLKTLETDVLEFEEAEVSPDDFKVTKAKVERVAKGIFLKGLHCKDLYSTLQTAGDKPEDPSELLHWVLKHEKHRKELRKAKSRGTAPLVTKVRVVHDSISDSSSDDETPTASARVVRTGPATTTPATAPASAVGATAVPAGEAEAAGGTGLHRASEEPKR